MHILVDADACPVKTIIVNAAKKRHIPVIMVCDTSHELYDGYSTVIIVEKGRDSADIKLANLLIQGDIIVTQDYGVAALALGKGAKAIRQDGFIYTNENIERLLFERHLGQKIRRTRGKFPHIHKRLPDDDLQFSAAFEKLLDEETSLYN